MDIDTLTWLEPVPVIFAHGIGGAHVVGNNVNIVMYVWRDIGGKLARVPALELVRPMDSLVNWDLRRMLARELMTHQERRSADH